MDLDIFGDWTARTSDFTQAFASARPYEHVVIPHFFKPCVAEQLSREFPTPRLRPDLTWYHYDNPLEQKYAMNDFSSLSRFSAVFDALQSDDMVRCMREVSGIGNLEADPYLHGAGIHAYPCRGKLDVHLDYSIHPITGKERRLNAIIYLNKEWDAAAWGGGLELFDEARESSRVIDVAWNTCVLFRTCDTSFHGIPWPIQCPEHLYRQSLAIYYVSPARAGAAIRPKAEYFPLCITHHQDRLRRLYDIRKTRILTATDLEDWPTWREDGHGYW